MAYRPVTAPNQHRPATLQWARRRRLPAGILSCVFVGVAAIVIGSAGSPVPARGQESGNANADGGQIFKNQGCVGCHGDRGGGSQGPALANNADLGDTNGVVTQILNGGGIMPAFGDQLSNAEIAAVATFIRTNWGNDFGEVATGDVAQVRGSGGGGNGSGRGVGEGGAVPGSGGGSGGAAAGGGSGGGAGGSGGSAGGGNASSGARIFQAQGCVGCHGNQGGGSQGPALANNADLGNTNAVVTQILNGGGIMPAFGNALSNAEIAAVATYIRGNWGNDYAAVTTGDVAQVRGSGGGGGGGAAGGGNAGVAAASGGAGGNAAAGNPTENGNNLTNVAVTDLLPGGGLVQPPASVPALDAAAAERGMADFANFNCAACHAPNGGGAIGPALSNRIFIYGNAPENIFLSIKQGRPNGMPAWGVMLPDATIWDLVAYVLNISDAPSDSWGTLTNLDPRHPAIEQVPAEFQHTATPWEFTEPIGDGAPPEH